MTFLSTAFAFGGETETQKINTAIAISAGTAMNTEQIIANEIADFLAGKSYELALIGENYYRNHTDIEKKRRLTADGKELKHRTNTRLEHAFYRKMVDQISGYLLTKTPTVMPVSKDEAHAETITSRLDRAFWRSFAMAGRCAINQAVTWLQPYIDGQGALKFAYIPGYEVIPLWQDATHTTLDAIIRTYEITEYLGKEKRIVRKAEYWTTEGVKYYVYSNGTLLADVEQQARRGNGHFSLATTAQNGDTAFAAALWDGRVPFIPVRYNDIEQPLIDVLKSNIDTYNLQASVHADMLADIPLALIVVKGYGGDPDEARHDIMTHMIAMLQSDGDITYAQPTIETDSVETMLTRIRRDIFSFGAGVDGQDEGQDNKSGSALMHKRTDLDTICNNFEVELQSTMEGVLWFVHQHALMMGEGDYTEEAVAVTFNRDIVIAESQTITDIKNSMGIVSKRTLLSKHPYVDDVEEEEKQIETEADAEQARFEENMDSFGGGAAGGGGKGGFNT